MKKMDEMEQLHALKAIRITFIYSIIFEVVCWIIECLKAKEIVTNASIMFFLIITQGIVLILSQSLLKGKIGDYRGFLVIIAAFVLR